jgi:uncharacterized membrane protein
LACSRPRAGASAGRCGAYRAGQRPFAEAWQRAQQTELLLRAALITVVALCALFGSALIALAQHYHVFGN